MPRLIRTGPVSFNPEEQRSIQDAISAVIESIRQDFSEKGEEFNSSDLENLVTTAPPSMPPFPFFILSLAILKDVLDVLLTPTVVLMIVTFMLGFVIGIILTIWMWDKMSGGWWKKNLLKWIWRRLGLAIAIEIIPVAQLIPASTILVLMAHYKEVKVVRLFNLALEKLHSSGVIRYMR